MSDYIIEQYKTLKNLSNKFFDIVNEHQYSDLNRTPFKITTHNEYSYLQGSRNGAVYYCSGGHTFYSKEVAAMTMSNHLFANALQTIEGNRNIDQYIPSVVNYIIEASDLGLPEPEFVFYFEPDGFQDNTSYDYQFICDELNKYTDEDFAENKENIDTLTKMSQIFHAIKILIDKDSSFMKKMEEDIELLEKRDSHFLIFAHPLNEKIITALEGFIEIHEELKEQNISKDDIPF